MGPGRAPPNPTLSLPPTAGNGRQLLAAASFVVELESTEPELGGGGGQSPRTHIFCGASPKRPATISWRHRERNAGCDSVWSAGAAPRLHPANCRHTSDKSDVVREHATEDV